MLKHKKLLSALLAAVMLFTVTGCGGTDDEAEDAGATSWEETANITATDETDEELYEQAIAEGGEVTLYSISSRCTKVAEAFMDKYPEITCTPFDISTNDLLDKVTREHEAGQYVADVVHIKDEDGSLYNEYVRQDNAAMQTAQLAQEQANWEAQFNAGNSQWQQQFDASQQEYQDSLSAQNREYAYNLAMTMLAAGVMPDTNTLNEAGISTTEALNIRMASLTAEKSGSGGGGRSGSSGGGKSKMTLTTAKQAANAGVFSDDVLSVLRENGYTDEMLEAIYGYEPNRGLPEALSTSCITV